MSDKSELAGQFVLLGMDEDMQSRIAQTLQGRTRFGRLEDAQWRLAVDAGISVTRETIPNASHVSGPAVTAKYGRLRAVQRSQRKIPLGQCPGAPLIGGHDPACLNFGRAAEGDE